ncbi:HK97 family phage prohead protease/HK97 family phage major capsid protein,TIGR01554 [Nitrospirillum amazonense]|uniref:HK97 family phage prohead protease/HK97 family phage major capsid protein,TIGR01554 n=1 Tax=Nitrospirillum amazonense TaxID=28077 RepID=A0A560FKK8_9PROT|nr:phage major capsid protein [Nitrospirillum amazonense]TWB22143.1 HK97 family phage prohead protease/HK97 family phage major capsid protein,TIGR01554 [Nitrospirillum amazonense]
MADPTSVPQQIEDEARALAQRLAEVAQSAVANALKAGAIVTVPDVVNSLQGLTETLPPALVAVIADALPGIADRAIELAQVEIAQARDESGQPYPPTARPTPGDFTGWASTAATALVAALVKAATDATTPADGKVASDTAGQVKAALDAVNAAAADAVTQVGPIGDTAAARAVGDSRMAVFRDNSDVVPELRFTAIEDSKTSQVCQHLDGATFSTTANGIPQPPIHPGCRSHLAAVMGIKRKAGATAKEIDRQDWAVYRRLQRQAAADQAQAEGRAVEHLEVRFAPAQGEPGTFTGYAATWGELDRHGTAFAPGAFSSSLAEHRARNSRLPMLWNHSPDQVIGSWDAVEEDGKGLKVAGRLVTETRAGAEAYALLKAGALNGLSVGFRRLRDQARPGGGRTITAADLAEISLVGIPSNASARVNEVRAAPNAGPDPVCAPDCHHHHHNREEAVMADETTAGTGQTETRQDPGAAQAAVEALAKRLDRLEARSARTGLGGGDASTDAAADLERRAFARYLRTGTAGMGADETRALRLSDDEAAGYLAPPDFQAEIDKDLTLFSPIRALATVRTTGRSEVNTLRRTSPAAATWVGEDDDRPETEVKYGQQSFQVKELATFVDCSLSLLEDAAVDVAAELASEFAEAFGVTESQAFVNGDGALKPMGFMADPNLSYTPGGDASAVKADGLIDLFHALKPAYRQNGVWLMNSTTLAAVRKLKDSQGRYLVDIGGMANAPSTLLLGRPVVEAVDMPDVAGGAFPIAFGDFGIGFSVYDRVALSIVRDDFTQRTKGRVRFHGRRRVAAGVRRPEAIRKLKIATS